MLKSFLAFALCLLSLPAVAGMELSPLRYDTLPGWRADDHGEAIATFQHSCTKLTLLPANVAYGTGVLTAQGQVWQEVCEEASMVDPKDTIGARLFFERLFTPYLVRQDGNPQGRFTGYYEPLLRGAWSQKPGYAHPVYGKPEDLVQGQIYPFTRHQIDNGAIANRQLERMWVNDPVDLFFLHVQGSGRVLMDTGEMVSLRFDAKTNQPYTAIGRVLVQRGELTPDSVSAPAIRQWLKSHPNQMWDVMHRNNAYVFFTISPETGDSPVGAQNVPLTPERSLAVDTAFIPLGMPVYLMTHLPQTSYSSGEAYNRLMIAQDKGSAITGTVRGDVFFGFGDRAEALAGYMKSDGQYAVLVPKTISNRISNRR